MYYVSENTNENVYNKRLHLIFTKKYDFITK